VCAYRSKATRSHPSTASRWPSHIGRRHGQIFDSYWCYMQSRSHSREPHAPVKLRKNDVSRRAPPRTLDESIHDDRMFVKVRLLIVGESGEDRGLFFPSPDTCILATDLIGNAVIVQHAVDMIAALRWLDQNGEDLSFHSVSLNLCWIEKTPDQARALLGSTVADALAAVPPNGAILAYRGSTPMRSLQSASVRLNPSGRCHRACQCDSDGKVLCTI